MKIVSIIGTRPEAIKMAPVVKALALRERVVSKVVATAQHRELTDEVLGLFEVRPDYDLDLMTRDQTPSQIAGAVIAKLAPLLQFERPDWVLVQGDTTTTMAAAIAASYARAHVAHVEAGLRTHDKREPFPEELNRRVVGAIADLHFAPTASARCNLLNEGVEPRTVVVTGNPVIDALRWAVALPPADHTLSALGADPDVRLVLLTAHRRENFGRGIDEICRAVTSVCDRYGDRVRVVYPVHPNPNVSTPVHRALGGIKQVTLLPPLPYGALVHLMARAYLVLTDSGGIQEEAPSLGKPVLVLRDVTERPEAVTAGTVRLVGTDSNAIIRAVSELWDDAAAYRRMTMAHNPYGDGRAADRIVKLLLGEPVDEFAPSAVETAAPIGVSA